jgi:glutaredoxin
MYSISVLAGIQKQDDVKQSLADALAGPVADPAAVLAGALAKAKSAPCFLFTWSNSPACKKATAALDRMGATYQVQELDQPWAAGNPVRAVLGRHLGRTSVPMVFVGGAYVGGFSDGPSDAAPGLVNLAFDGKLRPMLKEAGALAT